MLPIHVEYVCPCCGYRGLGGPPYAKMPPPPWARHPAPPYCAHYGDASYDVCPCCGFEYGNDDEPGTAPPTTFDEYRREWIAGGCHWFDLSRRLANWSLAEQLHRAGIREAE